MKVLLIEDDPFFRKFYAVKLAESQFEVTLASDGEEGIEQAKLGGFNIILLDLIMPKVDGFSFLTMRSQDPVAKTIPVLVFSTLGQEADVEHAKQLGAEGYVNKSFLDFSGLLTKIQAVMKP